MNTAISWSSFISGVNTFLPKLLEAVIVIAIGWVVSKVCRRLCKRALEKANRDIGAISFLSSAVSVGIKLITIIMALSSLGLNTNVIVGAFSAVGLGVSLALKDNMANVAGGIQMLFTKPFHVGDYIAAENVEGSVERIELMFTVLRTPDNKEVIFPNSRLTDSIITNYTAQKKRRLDMEFGISYSDDLIGAQRLLRKIVEKNTKVMKEPAPLIAVNRHGDSAVVLTVRLWCKTEEYWNLYFEMQETVKLAFDKAGYHIPFPQLDIHSDQKAG